MAPVILAAIIAAASAATQSGAGLFQQAKARKLAAQYPRPVATTSQSIKDLTNYAYARTMDQDVPGGELYRNEIKGATASGIKAASELGSGSEAYGMLGQLVSREQNAFSSLDKMSSERKSAAESAYMSVLAGPANTEDQRVNYWNNEMPYLQAQQAASALSNSGGMNLMSGSKSMAGVATELGTSLLNKKNNSNSNVSMTQEQLNELISSITNRNSN